MSNYSAVVIARNEEKYIKKTVESILNQSIKPYRVVVVDDGSTDETAKILDTMPVVVKKMPQHDHNKIHYDILVANVRNVGLACISDDPVDWVYSGDADIILPPKYCETIMKCAENNNACIGAGIIKELDTLPMDGCRMIRYDWLKNLEMNTKWDSIYHCMVALVQGKNTLVCRSSDCIVIDQRPVRCNALERNTLSRSYDAGTLSRRMGSSLPLLVYSSVIQSKKHGFANGYAFFKGGLRTKRQVPEEIGLMYRSFVNGFIHKRLFNKQHPMLYLQDKNMICHPP